MHSKAHPGVHPGPVLIASLLCVAASQVQAQSSGLAVGVGLRIRQQAYVGIDRDVRAIPLLTYENSWLRLSGLQADLKLRRYEITARHAVTGGLRMRYEDEGYEPGDAVGLAGMTERNGSLWTGIATTWHNPWADLSAEWLVDASRHSEGRRAQLQVSRRFAWNGIAVTPRAQVDWLSSDYVNYYFGVRSVEATLARPAYVGRSAVTHSLGLRTDYALTPQHQLFVDLSVTRLPSEIEDSPVVDRRGTARAFMGYLYRF